MLKLIAGRVLSSDSALDWKGFSGFGWPLLKMCGALSAWQNCLEKLVKAMEASSDLVGVTGRQRIKDYHQSGVSPWRWWMSTAPLQGFEVGGTSVSQPLKVDRQRGRGGPPGGNYER